MSRHGTYVFSNMVAFVMLAVLGTANSGYGGDWPMWRYDSARGAASPHPLAAQLHRQWSRRLPRSLPAWPPTQTKLQFDTVPQPVVAGQRIFLPSNVTDSVTAYDTRSGDQIWQFYADAPVRFAPVATDACVYFVSDDGYLYCLDHEGNLNWRLNGGPTRRSVLGNRRLVSSWPARGGPVLHNGRLFFAASIWPFMGIFIHAIDPDTGSGVWTNSGDGLIIPGGRSTPAVYDANSGAMRHFVYDKQVGGHDVTAARDCYFVAGSTYNLADGERLAAGRPVVADDRVLVYVEGDEATGLAAESQPSTSSTVDRRGRRTEHTNVTRPQQCSSRRVRRYSRPAPDTWLLTSCPRAANRSGAASSKGERRPC
jgi:hypothetical protein